MSLYTRTRRYPFTRRNCRTRSLLLERLECRLCLSTVAYWRFEEGIPDQPATGINTILDSSGYELHGTPINGPVYRADVGDNPIPQTGEENTLSLQFERGNRQRVFIEDAPAFQLTGSLTLEAYIKPTGSFEFAPILFRGDDRFALDPYVLAIGRSDLLFHVEDASGRIAQVRATLPGFGQWLHVAGTLDEDTGRIALYINGDLVAFSTTTIRPFAQLSQPNPGLGIGNLQSAQFDWCFPGRIDEVRISDQALTPDRFLNAVPPVASFYVYPDSGTVTARVPFDLSVFALDAKGQVVPDYTGEVQFWSTDIFGRHPYLYTFQPADQGVAYFPGGVTFYTPGVQELYVFDTATFSVIGYAVFDVVGNGPSPGGAPGGGRTPTAPDLFAGQELAHAASSPVHRQAASETIGTTGLQQAAASVPSEWDAPHRPTAGTSPAARHSSQLLVSPTRPLQERSLELPLGIGPQHVLEKERP